MRVDEALVTNATDAEQLAYAQRVARERSAEEDADVRDELSTKAGRRRVWIRLARYGLWEDIGGDLERVYRALGRRALGLEELHAVMRHPDLFLQMQNEAMKRERDEARAAAALQTRRRGEETATE